MGVKLNSWNKSILVDLLPDCVRSYLGYDPIVNKPGSNRSRQLLELSQMSTSSWNLFTLPMASDSCDEISNPNDQTLREVILPTNTMVENWIVKKYTGSHIHKNVHYPDGVLQASIDKKNRENKQPQSFIFFWSCNINHQRFESSRTNIWWWNWEKLRENHFQLYKINQKARFW